MASPLFYNQPFDSWFETHEDWSYKPLMTSEVEQNASGFSHSHTGPVVPSNFCEFGADSQFFADGPQSDIYNHKPIAFVNYNLSSDNQESLDSSGSYQWRSTSGSDWSAFPIDTQPNSNPISSVLSDILLQISNLSLPMRQQVAHLVDSLQPGVVQKNAGEWSFSVNQLNDTTIQQLQRFLSPSVCDPLLDSAMVVESPRRKRIAQDDIDSSFVPSPKRIKSEENSEEYSELNEDSMSEFSTASNSTPRSNSDESIESSIHNCSHCKKSFTSQTGLAKHIRIHSDDRTFACTHPGCGKKFSHSSTLKDHMNIHFQRKPYQCKECGKGFPNGSNLNRHARIHTKSKPYVCNICNKAFSQSSNLRVHQKIHSRPPKSD